ncbi:aprataxin [Cardiocondyla obscurior]|uniref:aprataxin n=1 Tax=Cardiocondyla obscurior TaxID=286306 RepID=UPI0039656FF1
MEKPECKVKEDDKQIKKHHQDLIMHMHNVACDLAKNHVDHDFIMGYHALPSMFRLHLHVVSTDFDSPYLKNKKHWNFFITPFFLHSSDICYQLHYEGNIKKEIQWKYVDYLRKTELKCHKCLMQPKNMPDLKRHLLAHINK